MEEDLMIGGCNDDVLYFVFEWLSKLLYHTVKDVVRMLTAK